MQVQTLETHGLCRNLGVSQHGGSCSQGVGEVSGTGSLRKGSQTVLGVGTREWEKHSRQEEE